MSTTHKINLAQVILISCVAAIGGFLFGYDSGAINGTVDALQKAFHSTSVGTGFNVASMLLGCAVGAFVAGALADIFGRKLVMIITAICFCISAWGAGISSNSLEFVIYRVIGGFSVGAASVICPAYISEIAPAALRGRLASLQQLAIVLGLLMAFVSNYFIAAAAGGASNPFWFGFQAWQWMFWMESIPSVVFLIALFAIPESPRYLVAAGRHDHARSVFQRLGLLAHEAEQKVKEVLSTLDQGHKPKMRDLKDKSTGRIYPILWVGIGLAALQQFVGINVVFYYGEVLWQAAGFSKQDSLLINVISGSVNIVSTFVAISLVDKLGRKPLLIIGSIGMTIALGAMSLIFGMSAAQAGGELKLAGSTGTIALVAANLYVFFFGISWGPVMWVMLGEMFKNKIRGAALAISGFTQWISNFAITMTFPIFLKQIGLVGAYGFYALCAFFSLFFVVFFVRETKGMTLEEM